MRQPCPNRKRTAKNRERGTAGLQGRVQGQRSHNEPGRGPVRDRQKEPEQDRSEGCEGIQTGNPPYEELISQMGQLIRKQLPLLQPLTEYLGAFRSIEFRGVESGGTDQYDLHCERGTSRWRILLSADGEIALASYDWDRPKSATSSRDRASLSEVS